MAKPKLPSGYYDPAECVLVHRDYLTKLQRAARGKLPTPEATCEQDTEGVARGNASAEQEES